MTRALRFLPQHICKDPIFHDSLRGRRVAIVAQDAASHAGRGGRLAGCKTLRSMQEVEEDWEAALVLGRCLSGILYPISVLLNFFLPVCILNGLPSSSSAEFSEEMVYMWLTCTTL